MQSLLILGRQAELGLAELESLYGSTAIELLNNQAVLLDIDPSLVSFNRLGGSIKLAKHLATLDTTDWRKVEDFLVEWSAENSKNLAKGKINLGLSLYGFEIHIRNISKSALNIKRAIQKTGRNVRIVPNKALELNAAQVIHNKLTNDRSWELLIVKSRDKTYISQTIVVQDIRSYSDRDQARPYRDSRVGMLPPKLAQIIINLAVGKIDKSGLSKTILDPFVGSGVLLQEASLMGYEVIGTDLDHRMVDYTKKNLDWLAEKYKLSLNLNNISTGDAKNTSWPDFDFIATETSLGKPISSLPGEGEFSKMIKNLDELIKEFLINVAKQTKPGVRLCLGVPAWQTSPDRFKHLPIIDHLTEIGYNFIDFKLINRDQLIYYRPKQLVARQLITLIRK
jgi:tRNA G10  N-methylase Trm11